VDGRKSGDGSALDRSRNGGDVSEWGLSSASPLLVTTPRSSKCLPCFWPEHGAAGPARTLLLEKMKLDFQFSAAQ
jgi:hypothetical protein